AEFVRTGHRAVAKNKSRFQAGVAAECLQQRFPGREAARKVKGVGSFDCEFVNDGAAEIFFANIHRPRCLQRLLAAEQKWAARAHRIPHARETLSVAPPWPGREPPRQSPTDAGAGAEPLRRHRDLLLVADFA